MLPTALTTLRIPLRKLRTVLLWGMNGRSSGCQDGEVSSGLIGEGEFKKRKKKDGRNSGRLAGDARAMKMV